MVLEINFSVFKLSINFYILHCKTRGLSQNLAFHYFLTRYKNFYISTSVYANGFGNKFLRFLKNVEINFSNFKLLINFYILHCRTRRLSQNLAFHYFLPKYNNFYISTFLHLCTQMVLEINFSDFSEM